MSFLTLAQTQLAWVMHKTIAALTVPALNRRT